MNADEGAYQLNHLYDQLIQVASSKDDVIISRPGSAASQVLGNILTGYEVLLCKKESGFSQKNFYIYIKEFKRVNWVSF